MGTEKIPPETIFTHTGKEDFLGTGSFGTVIRCYRKNFGVAALKLFKLTGSKESMEHSMKSIVNEFMILDLVKPSEFVITFYGVTIFEEWIGLLMEYAPRGSLDSLFKLYVPWNLRLRLLAEIANGVAFLHEVRFEKRVTHNDLKPQNILLDENFHVKICDFGGSNLDVHTSRLLSKESRKASNVYTTNYAAPEFLTSETPGRTKAMDVYSYSMITYFGLTGHHPFEKMESYAVEYRVGNKIRPDYSASNLKAFAAQVDHPIIEMLADVMEKAWQQDPKSRPTMKSIFLTLQEPLKGIELEIAKSVELLKKDLELKPESSINERVDMRVKLENSSPNIGLVNKPVASPQTYAGIKATCSTTAPLMGKRSTPTIDFSELKYKLCDVGEELYIEIDDLIFVADVTKTYLNQENKQLKVETQDVNPKATCSKTDPPRLFSPRVKRRSIIELPGSRYRFCPGDEIYVITSDVFYIICIRSVFTHRLTP